MILLLVSGEKKVQRILYTYLFYLKEYDDYK